MIYVASLSDYNDGILLGDWIRADRDPDELFEDISRMLSQSEQPIAEEWAVHDYQGFGDLPIGEYEDLTWLTGVAHGITEHGPAYAHWAATTDRTRADDETAFLDDYLGEYDSTDDLITEWIHDTYDLGRHLQDLPEHIARYLTFDEDAFLRDLRIELDIIDRPDGGVWVFSE